MVQDDRPLLLNRKREMVRPYIQPNFLLKEQVVLITDNSQSLSHRL